MIKTVKDLKEALEKFDENLPVVIRRAEEKGYVSDWRLHNPGMFGSGKVCLSAFEPYDDDYVAVTND